MHARQFVSAKKRYAYGSCISTQALQQEEDVGSIYPGRYDIQVEEFCYIELKTPRVVCIQSSVLHYV